MLEDTVVAGSQVSTDAAAIALALLFLANNRDAASRAIMLLLHGPEFIREKLHRHAALRMLNDKIDIERSGEAKWSRRTKSNNSFNLSAK